MPGAELNVLRGIFCEIISLKQPRTALLVNLLEGELDRGAGGASYWKDFFVQGVNFWGRSLL